MKLKYLNLFAILSLLLTCNELLAWEKLVWANRSSNMNDAASWNDLDGNVSTIAPSKDTLLIFSSKAAVQPVLTADLSAIGLYFVAHTNSTLPSVHPADGFGGYNYDGYNITAENGASLYLYGNQHNNGWTRDFYMASLGTNVIDAPIVFADNGSQHQARCSGGRLILKQPLVATSNTKFFVGGNAMGRVVFESANFNGASVRVTAKKQGMRTESSARFEKGLDAENTLAAIERACELVELLGAGEVVDGIIDVYPGKTDARTVKFDPARINSFLGTNIAPAFMETTLASLGFGLNGLVNGSAVFVYFYATNGNVS